MEDMTKKEEIAIKFAINTMGKYVNRYFMSAINYTDENGEQQKLSYGESINVLNEMIQSKEH